MINHIKKEFNKLFNTATADKEATEMKTTPAQPELAATETAAQLATALETVAAQAATLTELSEKFTELSNKFETAQAALAEVEAAKAALVAEAAQKRLTARTEAVVAAVGTVKASTLLAATEALDDAQFTAIVDAMKTTMSAEEKSVMFTEVGVSDVADPVQAVAAAESAEAKLLKTKYKKK